MLAVGAKGRWGGLAHKDSLEEEREDGVIDLISTKTKVFRRDLIRCGG